MPKEIQIDTLLASKSVLSIPDKILEFYANKVILITGAAGTIGSALVDGILKSDFKRLVLIDNSELGVYTLQQKLKDITSKKIEFNIADIKDDERIDTIFNEFEPELIFHAAAYKHVPLMELHPQEALKTNFFGTKTLVDKAIKYKSNYFIHISTDKAVKPIGVMGISKQLAEQYIVHSSNTSDNYFKIARFGNVINSSGSVLPLWKEQLKLGLPLSLTDPEVERYFISLDDAVYFIMASPMVTPKNTLLLCYDMGNPIKLADIARFLISSNSSLYQENDFKIIGLRPGEKLKEELLNSGESFIQTNLDNILGIKNDNPSLFDDNRILKTIEAIRNTNDSKSASEQLKDLAKSFK